MNWNVVMDSNACNTFLQYSTFTSVQHADATNLTNYGNTRLKETNKLKFSIWDSTILRSLLKESRTWFFLILILKLSKIFSNYFTIIITNSIWKLNTSTSYLSTRDYCKKISILFVSPESPLSFCARTFRGGGCWRAFTTPFSYFTTRNYDDLDVPSWFSQV